MKDVQANTLCDRFTSVGLFTAGNELTAQLDPVGVDRTGGATRK